MKNLCSLTALLVAFALTLFETASAAEFPPTVFEINGVIAPAAQLNVTQTVVNGKTLFTITAHVDLAIAPKFLSLISEMMSSSANAGGGGTMKVLIAGADGVVIDAREYSDISIRRISMPGLDALGRTTLPPCQVEITARVQKQLPAGGSVSALGRKPLMTVGDFSLSVADLPSANVLRVSSRSLIPCTIGLCDSLTSFEVLILGNDRLAWSTWFQQVASNPSLKKTGSLTLKSSTGAIVAKLAMSDIIAVSYEEIVESTGVRGRLRLNVGKAFFKL